MTITITQHPVDNYKTGGTCFEATSWISKHIANEPEIDGTITINGTAVMFSFSSQGMDGDIFSHDEKLRTIIKYLIPLYVYNNLMDSARTNSK